MKFNIKFITKNRFKNKLFSVVFLLVFNFQLTHSVGVQLHIHEDKLSSHNDTNYLRQVMRNAKSAEMRGYMNSEVAACDSFFEFACGNWPKINPANDIQPRETNFFDLLSRTYQRRQLRVLKTASQGKNNEAENKVKDFYDSCEKIVKTENNLRQYKFQLREIINEFGYMPALLPKGSWRSNDFDWLKTIGKIQNRYGIDIILQISVRPDFENTTQNKVFFGEPALYLYTKSMYTGEATKWYRDQYKLKIQQQLQMNLEMNEERAGMTATEILDFEIQLAHGLFNQRTTKTLKSLAKLRTVEELRTTYAPVIDFEKYLSAALGQPFNDSAYEYMIQYQENLIGVLKKAPKEQLANYIFYQLLKPFFYERAKSSADQEKKCLGKTKLFFTKILDNIIFNKFITKGDQQEVDILWKTLKQTFNAELQSEKLNWMSLMTRKLAMEKLEAMRLEINSYISTNFTVEYAEIQINPNDYIGNFKQLLNHRAKHTIAALYEPPKPVEESMRFSFSPVYVGTENLIRLPVAILQPHFLWSTHYPKALKFGTLGYLLAHEMLHGFDDIGCNYDNEGQERNWWDQNTTKAFNERKECFKSQYAHYLYGGKYLPESDLQAENIADNGAIQVAYTAYKNWLSSLPEGSEEMQQTEVLPFLNYTSGQLFFISFAQFWCNDVNEHLKDKVSLVDLHAPAMYRVIGPLANFNEFANEFLCARGTTMNPEHKCQIY